MCKNKIEQYFDIVNIIKKFEETHQMKKVLFKDYQIKMLNYLDKPCVYIDKEHNFYRDYDREMIRRFSDSLDEGGTIIDENILKLF